MTSDSTNAEVTDTDHLFTVESANRTLPLVKVIVKDLTRLYQDIVDRRERLDVLKKKRGGIDSTSELYAEELTQIEQKLVQEGQDLERFISELDELGLVSRNGIHGVVGYPAMIEGRLVELCWVLGEDEVAFFHEVGGDPDERQLLNSIGAV